MTDEEMYHDALEHYHNGEFDAARNLLTQCAVRGNPGAMDMLGTLYSEGHGTAIDYNKAIIWYKRAIKKGVSYASANLGLTYKTMGNIRRAIYWLRRSANEGFAESYIEFAKIHLSYQSEKRKRTALLLLHEALNNHEITEYSKSVALDLIEKKSEKKRGQSQ